MSRDIRDRLQTFVAHHLPSRNGHDYIIGDSLALALERIALALLEREVLDGSEVRQLIDGTQPLPAFNRPQPPPPSDGSQQVIKPEPGRRMPGMLPESGPQPA